MNNDIPQFLFIEHVLPTIKCEDCQEDIHDMPYYLDDYRVCEVCYNKAVECAI